MCKLWKELYILIRTETDSEVGRIQCCFTRIVEVRTVNIPSNGSHDRLANFGSFHEHATRAVKWPDSRESTPLKKAGHESVWDAGKIV